MAYALPFECLRVPLIGRSSFTCWLTMIYLPGINLLELKVNDVIKDITFHYQLFLVIEIDFCRGVTIYITSQWILVIIFGNGFYLYTCYSSFISNWPIIKWYWHYFYVNHDATKFLFAHHHCDFIHKAYYPRCRNKIHENRHVRTAWLDSQSWVIGSVSLLHNVRLPCWFSSVSLVYLEMQLKGCILWSVIAMSSLCSQGEKFGSRAVIIVLKSIY